MPEARLERTRKAYKGDLIECKHFFMFVGQSDVAPFYVPTTGNRRTTEICFNCGLRRHYDRTQAEFEKEAEDFFRIREDAK